LVVFVVLLICVVAAFFSGVWIGQRDEQTAIAERAEALSEEPTAVGENGEVQELHFFSGEDSETPPSLAEVAEEPQPDTTLAEDVGVKKSEEPPRTEPAAPIEVTTGRGTKAGSTDKPEQPAKVAETAPRPQQPTVASAASTVEGEHVIQVFSSADESQAKKLISQLSGGGFPAFLSPVEVGGQTMYRVRIGPYAELSDAETIAARVRRSYKLDTWVTR
jgi:cell division septation protein DedD